EAAPHCDFPILIRIGELERKAPQLDLTRGDGVQAAFSVDSDGSVASIIAMPHTARQSLWLGEAEELNELRRRKRGIVICQDGIAVAEMGLPQAEEVEWRLLAHYQVLVDL